MVAYIKKLTIEERNGSFREKKKFKKKRFCLFFYRTKEIVEIKKTMIFTKQMIFSNTLFEQQYFVI